MGGLLLRRSAELGTNACLQRPFLTAQVTKGQIELQQVASRSFRVAKSYIHEFIKNWKWSKLILWSSLVHFSCTEKAQILKRILKKTTYFLFSEHWIKVHAFLKHRNYIQVTQCKSRPEQYSFFWIWPLLYIINTLRAEWACRQRFHTTPWATRDRNAFTCWGAALFHSHTAENTLLQTSSEPQDMTYTFNTKRLQVENVAGVWFSNRRMTFLNNRDPEASEQQRVDVFGGVSPDLKVTNTGRRLLSWCQGQVEQHQGFNPPGVLWDT